MYCCISLTAAIAYVTLLAPQRRDCVEIIGSSASSFTFFGAKLIIYRTRIHNVWQAKAREKED
jgi:hypothetical protein